MQTGADGRAVGQKYISAERNCVRDMYFLCRLALEGAAVEHNYISAERNCVRDMYFLRRLALTGGLLSTITYLLSKTLRRICIFFADWR